MANKSEYRPPVGQSGSTELPPWLAGRPSPTAIYEGVWNGLMACEMLCRYLRGCVVGEGDWRGEESGRRRITSIWDCLATSQLGDALEETEMNPLCTAILPLLLLFLPSTPSPCLLWQNKIFISGKRDDFVISRSGLSHGFSRVSRAGQQSSVSSVL